MKKIAIAMSGGVDSSYAAYLLKEKGYNVIGITMQVWPIVDVGLDFEQAEHARGVAEFIGISHYIFDLRKEFSNRVVEDFCRAYQSGITPNPCVWCNPLVKFGILRKKSNQLGCRLFATGHYARIGKNNGRLILKKGKDKGKDQSYVLYRLSSEILKDIIFPLGDLNKKDVKTKVQKLGIPASLSKESQEICFIPDRNYPGFIEKYTRRRPKPGDIVNTSGKISGKHRGCIFYTIGQRRGLGIADKEPLYVISMDKDKNRVIVGHKNEVYGNMLIAHRLNWIGMDMPKRAMYVKARIRYNAKDANVRIKPISDKELEVEFETPQMAITPGQSVVFYKGERVLGGGEIANRRQSTDQLA